MLGTALYFPHIDIRDPAWLRSAILFWDEIQTIAPSAIEEPYQQEDTRVCQAEGYLRPLRCDLHPHVIEDLGRKILRLGDRENDNWWTAKRTDNPIFQSVRRADEIGWELEDAFDEVGMHRGKMSPEVRELAFRLGLSRMHRGKVLPRDRRLFRDLEMAQMHPDKMPRVMRDLFESGPLSGFHDEEWLLVDSRFADAYMSALAAQLSQQLTMSPLTSYERAQGMSFRFMFDDVVDNSLESASGAMIGVVMRGLQVDASVPVSRLLKFREKRKDQYLDFAGKISDLSEQLSEAGEVEGEELFTKAQKAYDKDIEPSLRALKRELNHQSISTAWAGAYRAITISVPSAGALAYFTGLTGPALLGAGAALAAADIGVRGYLAGQKIRAGNPFSYLHDINANFGLPDFVDA
ncbi:hypothetical protein EU803_15715 [Loktanella sp. IMCC34160]|uniref:DUF6236 family protein n=1 Tax=Loktanella sp. IMCC34160 TaxID=2510646 RepID=UPI00101D4215|nr:DUF6236 family protein [Loktanella sp. IMCC34160]RYG90058.1 hypothetical protein EU803_15715 [Loktanella sp. IMCC34160]